MAYHILQGGHNSLIKQQISNRRWTETDCVTEWQLTKVVFKGSYCSRSFDGDRDFIPRLG